MPIFIAALVLIVLSIGAVVRRVRNWRADKRFQRSILVYDKARRERIRRGEDPRLIPTAEEDLYLKGYGALVPQIKRVSWFDPPPSYPTPAIPSAVHTAPPVAAGRADAMAEPKPPSSATRLSPVSAPHLPILGPSRPLPLPGRRMVPSTPVAPDDPPESQSKQSGTGPSIARVPRVSASQPAAPSRRIAERGATQLGPSRALPLPDRRMVPSTPVVPDDQPPQPKTSHEPSPIGHRFRMEYADINGEITIREVRVDGVELYQDHLTVAAFCFMRLDQRHFRVDRILHIADAASGDVIHDVSALFAPHAVEVLSFREISTVSVGVPYVPLTMDQRRLLDRVTAGLDVLVWISRADDGLDNADHETMFGFISDRLALPSSRSAGLAWDRTFVTAWLQERRPTLATCNATLAAMPDKSRERPILKRAAEAIARTEARAKRLRQLARLLP